MDERMGGWVDSLLEHLVDIRRTAVFSILCWNHFSAPEVAICVNHKHFCMIVVTVQTGL